MDSDQESVKTVTDEQMDSGRSTCSSMSDHGSVKTMIRDEEVDSGRFSSMSDQWSVKTASDELMNSRRSSLMSDQGSVMDSRRSSLMSDQGSFKKDTDELMDSGRCSSMTKQGSIKTMREEPQTRIKEEPNPYVKLEQKTPFKDNKQITVLIRGQGSQTKALQISRTASLDAFISEVNSLFGFGREPGNTYIVHNGKQLSRGTQTIEKAGIQDRSNVDLCVRTLGG